MFIGSGEVLVSHHFFEEDEDKYKHFVFLVLWIKTYKCMNEWDACKDIISMKPFVVK